ncbi:MAG: Sua5/YciO/YrdC/YwlC family protein [Phycisphaerae bacterium]
MHDIIQIDQTGEAAAGVCALNALRSGSLVVLPTETLYALAAPANRRATVEKLRTIKQIGPFPGWVLHLARPSHIHHWVRRPNRVLDRLIDQLWPGPLALRIVLDESGRLALSELLGPETFNETVDAASTVTFRCPDHVLTRTIIQQLDVPLIMIGVKPGAAGRRLDTALADTKLPPLLAIDAGPGRYGGSSTLVEVTDSRWKILRPGAIAERTIRRLMEQMIVFVCSGNTCRSPMAEQIAKMFLSRRLGAAPEELADLGWNITSAGVHAGSGAPATAEAQAVIRELGGSLEKHRSRPATADLLLRADLVLTMTESLRQEILDTLPSLKGKVSRLDPDSDVIDPIGGTIDIYRQTAKTIQQLVEKRIEELVA